MRLIGLAVVLMLSLILAPPAVDARQPAKPPRIGYLGAGSPSAAQHLLEAFRQGLRELGYVEGQNLTIDYRWAEGRQDRLPGLAEELVRLNVDVIVSHGAVATRAAQRATAAIPVVFASSGDAVATGLVASLARAGGNVTGLTIIAPELTGKRLPAMYAESEFIVVGGLMSYGSKLVAQYRRAATYVDIRS